MHEPDPVRPPVPDLEQTPLPPAGAPGRFVGFFGPLLFGLATQAFDSQRAGMATVLAFFVIGFGLMLAVREPAR